MALKEKTNTSAKMFGTPNLDEFREVTWLKTSSNLKSKQWNPELDGKPVQGGLNPCGHAPWYLSPKPKALREGVSGCQI